VIFSVQFFYMIEQKNEKIFCIIKQRPHDKKCTVYLKVLLLSISFSQKSIAILHAILNMQSVLQYLLLTLELTSPAI